MARVHIDTYHTIQNLIMHVSFLKRVSTFQISFYTRLYINGFETAHKIIVHVLFLTSAIVHKVDYTYITCWYVLYCKTLIAHVSYFTPIILFSVKIILHVSHFSTWFTVPSWLRTWQILTRVTLDKTDCAHVVIDTFHAVHILVLHVSTLTSVIRTDFNCTLVDPQTCRTASLLVVHGSKSTRVVQY